MSAAPETLDSPAFRDAVEALAASHREMAAIVERWGVPDYWRRAPGTDTLARIILEQQVSLAAAATLHRRLCRTLGGALSARRLAATGAERLHALGVTRQKARYCVALASAVTERRLSLAGLARRPDAEALAELVALPGIGPWTASIYLIAALRRPDVWPPGDLALERALEAHFGPARAGRLAADGARWRPLRSVAAQLLWHDYLRRRGV